MMLTMPQWKSPQFIDEKIIVVWLYSWYWWRKMMMISKCSKSQFMANHWAITAIMYIVLFKNKMQKSAAIKKQKIHSAVTIEVRITSMQSRNREKMNRIRTHEYLNVSYIGSSEWVNEKWLWLQPISWTGAVISWSLHWLLGNFIAMTKDPGSPCSWSWNRNSNHGYRYSGWISGNYGATQPYCQSFSVVVIHGIAAISCCPKNIYHIDPHNKRDVWKIGHLQLQQGKLIVFLL